MYARCPSTQRVWAPPLGVGNTVQCSRISSTRASTRSLLFFKLSRMRSMDCMVYCLPFIGMHTITICPISAELPNRLLVLGPVAGTQVLADSQSNFHLVVPSAEPRVDLRTLRRTMGRAGLRRATSLKPARSYMDLAPNHMVSSLTRPRLSTG